MKSARSAIESSVRWIFGVDVYGDAFEKLALLDRWSRLSFVFQHKVPDQLRDHPLLFIHVPKNGGTSVKRALYSFDPGHATVRYYQWLAPSLREAATCFALVRDPVDRFLSSFDFLMNAGGGDASIQPAPMRRLAGIRTIDDYLDHLERVVGNWFRVDTFARPQWWYITDRSGAVAVDHLWVIGEQDRQIAELLASHNLPEPGHVNRTRRSGRRLSASQLSRVKRLYAPDFQLYDAVSRQPGAGGSSLSGIAVPQV